MAIRADAEGGRECLQGLRKRLPYFGSCAQPCSTIFHSVPIDQRMPTEILPRQGVVE